MGETAEQRVFSTVPPVSFVGRETELDAILQHARSGSGAGALVVLACPAAGVSELLRQAYDRLFFEQGDIIPFYFEFRSTDSSVKRASVRFLQSFITQLTAFRRNDPKLTAVTPDVCEISELTAPLDGTWIDALVESCKKESELNDEASFVKQALSAPIRAAAENAVVFPLIGGLEYTARFSEDTDLFEHVKETFVSFELPSVLSGKRRFLSNGLKKGTTRLNKSSSIELKGLDLESSSALCSILSGTYGVETTPQTRDLIGLQLQGSPVLIEALFQSEAARKGTLDCFKNVQQSYTRELFGGRIRGYFDSSFDNFSVNPEIQRKLLDLLYGSREFSSGAAPAENWSKGLGMSEAGFSKLMSAMNAEEFVNTSSNLIDGTGGSMAFNDYLSMRFRLEVERAPRSAVYGRAISMFLKRAPKMMAEFYRRKSSIGLKELLAVFNCQNIPASLFHYDVFKERHKGKPEGELISDLKDETERITLPQIVYTVDTISVYDQLSKFTDRERSAFAIGFEAADYTDESETVWIAAEVDSKLEAGPEVSGFWCDRLEMVALMSDYRQYRLWLIAPEGFSPEAVRILKQRNAIGSSRKQVELLIKHLDAEKLVGKVKPDNAFEMVVPMGEDTELIAAHAIEELARRHSFGAKAINQIKTALVEACINATEHSQSPDRKIYQRFEIINGSIVITVSNRGLRFKGKETKEISPSDGRRGWGLKLMKTLMDDVRFEQVDDGTRISMTKRLEKS